jgi:hypothetical protein
MLLTVEGGESDSWGCIQSGIGYSFGVPGARVGVNAKAKKYVRGGIPGTGLYYQSSQMFRSVRLTPAPRRSEFLGEPQGGESRHTLYMFRHEDKPYHIDYIFIPREWTVRLRTVEIGGYEHWSKLSDHCPVIVEILD